MNELIESIEDMQEQLKNARTYARRGWVWGVKPILNRVQKYAERNRIDITKEIQEIKTDEDYLKRAQIYRRELGIDINL